MSKFERIMIYGILSISLSFSIVVLCRIYPRYISYEKCNLGFDYMGVIVGVLALLVGFLVAWQIYKTIDVDKKIAMMSYSSKEAIAEDMFYRGYSKGIEDGKCCLYSVIKTCVAALNLSFTEEKAISFKEVIENNEAILRENSSLVDLIIKEIDKIKFKSKAIDECYKILQEKRKK